MSGVPKLYEVIIWVDGFEGELVIEVDACSKEEAEQLAYDELRQGIYNEAGIECLTEDDDD